MLKIEDGINAIHIELAAYSLNIPDVKTANTKKIEIHIVNRKNNADKASMRTCNNNNNRSLIIILHR
jgi:hypothetical protein